MTKTQRAAQGFMAVLGLLTCVFLASVYADTSESRFPDDANALVASAGIGLGFLFIVLAIAGINSGERWAWLALWVMPVFFVAHAALLGTWIPDGVFAVLSVAALMVNRPRYDRAPAAA
jgi:hypothetical protein